MPFPRMTTRRWMIAVAVAATVLVAKRFYSTASERNETADEHRAWVTIMTEYIDGYGKACTPEGMAHPKIGTAEELVIRCTKSLVYHQALERKYRRAACYPWLAVEPDPPEPK